MADMKWYIFNTEYDNVPLCWGETDVTTGEFQNPCLEFDTEEAAQRFVNAIQNIPFMADELGEMEIRHCIFYYDDGKMNATNLIPVANGDDIELKEVANEEI